MIHDFAEPQDILFVLGEPKADNKERYGDQCDSHLLRGDELPPELLPEDLEGELYDLLGAEYDFGALYDGADVLGDGLGLGK